MRHRFGQPTWMRYLNQHAISPAKKSIKKKQFTQDLSYRYQSDIRFLHAFLLALRININVDPVTSCRLSDNRVAYKSQESISHEVDPI